jgi:hypothetical protein
MKYKIVTSGTSKEVTLDRLSRSLRPQSEIYTLSGGEAYLGVISHKTLVFLATEFADYALRNYAKREIPEAEVCLSLARRWIEDDCSVSKEELRAAADAAYAADAAVRAAVRAANAAAYSAYAAYADAADAAYAYAAAHAANAAGKDREMEFIRQGKFILGYLKNNQWLFHL